MTLEQPNRRRFYQSITEAIKVLNDDAMCYYYENDPEYTELIQLLQGYQKNVGRNGVWYEINLNDSYGLFESGTVEFGDGTKESLICDCNVSITLNDTFLVQEAEQDIEIYPVRWHQRQHETHNELAIYVWDITVQRIIFTNNSQKEIVVTLDESNQMHLPAGKTDWLVHPKLIEQKYPNAKK